MFINFADCIFAKAAETDVKDFVSLIDKRIEWMEQNDIKQWNSFGYKQRYSYAYFKREADSGHLYVLRDNDSRIIAGAVLLESDPRWQKNDPQKPSLYVHNFASLLSVKGAGKELLRKIECLALQKMKVCVRLDVIISNDKLNSWYDDMGYYLIGTIVEGEYHGNLREKTLNG